MINGDWSGKHTFGIQVVDSCRSNGAIIAEDYGRGSTQDRVRFAELSGISVFETKHWINKLIA